MMKLFGLTVLLWFGLDRIAAATVASLEEASSDRVPRKTKKRNRSRTNRQQNLAFRQTLDSLDAARNRHRLNRALQQQAICSPSQPNPRTTPTTTSSGGKKGKSDSDEDGDGGNGLQEQDNSGLPSLAQTLRDAGFNALVAALEQTGLLATFQDVASPTKYTIFAPDDQAMNEFSSGIGSSLTQEELRNFLLYHVVPCEISYGNGLETIPAGDFPISVSTMLQDKSFQILKGSSGTWSTGYSFQGIGNNVNDLPEIVQNDYVARNGVIHGINKVMNPTNPPVATLANNQGFTILFDLLQAADLNEAAMDPAASLTVFAPRNSAFESAYTAAELENLKSDRDTLRAILLYHILDGETPSSAISGTMTVSTMLSESQTLTLSNNGGTVTVQGLGNTDPATVVAADVQASNGVVHVIDKILLPGSTLDDFFENSSNNEGGLGEQGGTSYSYWLSGLRETGLIGVLSDMSTTVTVLPPIDAAFEEFNQNGALTWLLGKPDVLTYVMSYHLLTGTKIMAGDITPSPQTVNTALDGATVEIYSDATSGTVYIQGASNSEATVVSANNERANGVVHGIDSVLIPPLRVGNRMGIMGGFSFFYEALADKGLLEDLNTMTLRGEEEVQYTIFAPTDEAFAAAGFTTLESLLALPNLENILKLHILDPESFNDPFRASSMVQNAALATLGLPTLLTSESVTVVPSESNPGTVSVRGGGNTAPFPNVVLERSDVTAINGIIVTIDGVLLPPN